MKKKICLVVILLSCFGVFAQEKMLPQAQFDVVYQDSLGAWSLENWKGKPFRYVIITGSSLVGRPQTDYSSKITTEYISPTVNRTIYETSFGGKKLKTEAIRLDSKFFVRKNDEEWTNAVTETVAATTSKTAESEKPLSEQVNYKFVGIEKLNNQNAKLYEVNISAKRINSNDGQESLTNTVIKYWFGEDGVLLKTDMNSETRSGDKIYRSSMTRIWELDESIRIAAPTLASAQK